MTDRPTKLCSLCGMDLTPTDAKIREGASDGFDAAIRVFQIAIQNLELMKQEYATSPSPPFTRMFPPRETATEEPRCGYVYHFDCGPIVCGGYERYHSLGMNGLPATQRSHRFVPPKRAEP